MTSPAVPQHSGVTDATRSPIPGAKNPLAATAEEKQGVALTIGKPAEGVTDAIDKQYGKTGDPYAQADAKALSGSDLGEKSAEAKQYGEVRGI